MEKYYVSIRSRRQPSILVFLSQVDMPATVTVADKEVVVDFLRRSHLPIILASGMMDKPIAVPWWNGRKLRLTTNAG